MSTNFNIIDLLKRRQPRQPWDEHTPSGESVPELLRQQSPAPAIQRAGLGVPGGDVLELLKQPATPPPPNEGRPATVGQMPQVRVGQSTAGLDPLQRQQAKVDLLRGSSPSSKVRDTGDFIEEGPPEQSPSRVKNALLGLLLGTAQGGLPGGIAGAATGAINPGSIQQLLRDRQVAKEEDRLERQIGVDAKRAGVEHTRAQTEALKEGRRQYVERSDGVYEISREYPNGRRVADIPAEARARPAASRHYFEREDGVYYVDEVNPQGVKLGGVPGKPASDAQSAQAAEGEALADSTRAAADELKATLDQQKGQLTENERSITQKEALWNAEAVRRVKAAQANLEDLKLSDALAQVKAEDEDFKSGVYDQTVENTKRLRSAIEDGDKRYSAMQQDVRQGRAKGARRRGGNATTDAATHAFSIAAYLSRNKGATEADARAYAKQHYPDYEVVP